jgi:hypothetical protein
MGGKVGSEENVRSLADRPLPELPTNGSSSDDDDISEEDEILDEEGDDDETTSTSYGLLDHLKDERKSSVSEVVDLTEDPLPCCSTSSSVLRQNTEEDLTYQK